MAETVPTREDGLFIGLDVGTQGVKLVAYDRHHRRSAGTDQS